MHYGRIRHGDKCATPFKFIMSFYVICVVCIFAWQFCHDLGEKDDVFLQKPRIWQMWYLITLFYVSIRIRRILWINYDDLIPSKSLIHSSNIFFFFNIELNLGGLIVIYAITWYTMNKLWSPDTIYWLLYLLLTDPLKSVYHTYLYRISSVDTWDSVCIYSSMINEIGDNMMCDAIETISHAM